MIAGRIPFVLRRVGNQPLLMSAAFASILLATTVLAGLLLLSTSVADAAVHRALDAMPAAKSQSLATLNVTADDFAKNDKAVRGAFAEAHPGVPVATTARGFSESYSMPGQAGREQPELTRFAMYEGLERQAKIVEGRWPRAGVMEAVLTTVAAEQMDFRAGETYTIRNRITRKNVKVKIVGLFELTNPADPRWDADLVLQRGKDKVDFTTFGPLVIHPRTFATPRMLGTGVAMRWRAVPDLGAVAPDRIAAVATAVKGLSAPDRPFPTVTTLGAELDQLARAALVGRSTMLVPILQLLVLAGYALLLTARLIVEHRRMDVALLRSRGAGTVWLSGLSMIEGLLVALPCAVLAPLLAPPLLKLINPSIPLDAGLNVSTFAISAAIAAACGLLLAAPAMRGARRTYVEEQTSRGRGGVRTLIQRGGADIGLLALAGVAVWQLQRYGAPATISGGELAIDPFIVAGPALALLSGGLVAMRLVPLLSRIAERVTSRRRGFAPALGAWQVSRRPLRYAGPALLLVMAVAIGVISLATGATWERSQADQAAHRTGADLRIAGSTAGGTLGPLGRGAVYADLPGVTGISPVHRGTADAGSRPATLLAADAAGLNRLLHFRPDLAGRPVSALARDLVAARPPAPALTAAGKKISVRVRLARDVDTDVDLAIHLRDRYGVPYRADAGTLHADGEPHDYDVDLSGMLGPDGRLAGPLSVTGFTIGAVPGTAIGLEILEMKSGGKPLDRPDGLAWQAVHRPGGPVNAEVRADTGLLRLDVPGGRVRGDAVAGELSLVPEGDAKAPLPVIVTADLAASLRLTVGDRTAFAYGGMDRPMRITGIVQSLPSAPGSAIMADWATLTRMQALSGEEPSTPTEWWAAAANTGPSAAVLRKNPQWEHTVTDRNDILRQLREDPLANGLQGALELGFITALAFAATGFAINAAVAARERMTEFALLRAFGVTMPQVFGLLAVEQAFLAALGLAGGLGLALVIVDVVVPGIVLTGQATAVQPAVILEIPWAQTAVLLGAVLLVLALIVAVLARGQRRNALAPALRAGEGHT